MKKNNSAYINECKKIVMVFFVFTYTTVFSQEENSKNSYNNSLYLKLNTTALIDDLSFPTIEVAVEKRFLKSYSVQFEAGTQVYELSNTVADTLNTKNFGYRFRLEGRYYLINNGSKNGFKIMPFTGINFLYRKNAYDTNYSYFKEDGNNSPPPMTTFTTINDNIGVDKTVYGANLLFGLQVFIGNNFFVEPVVYLGQINRTIKNFDRESPAIKDLEGKVSAKDYKNLQESSGATRNFSFAFRIGFNL